MAVSLARLCCKKTGRSPALLLGSLAPAGPLTAFGPGSPSATIACKVLAASQQADSVNSKGGAVEDGCQSFPLPSENVGKMPIVAQSASISVTYLSEGLCR